MKQLEWWILNRLKEIDGCKPGLVLSDSECLVVSKDSWQRRRFSAADVFALVASPSGKRETTFSSQLGLSSW